jgi:pyridoxamine 5'-phosphate oxidase
VPEETPADRLSAIRFDYDVGDLDEADVPRDPLEAVRGWVGAAIDAGEAEPTAMVVSTATPDGVPSARTVLLKGIDDTGLVFFTNRTSRKGRELAVNPRCAAVLRWDLLHRQVTVRGRAEQVADAESDAYFATRPRGSRIAAWASRQSEVIADRSVLEAWVGEADARFPGDDIPRPPFWGGYRIVPDEVQLWQGRPSRLHDRLRWRPAPTGDGSAWIVERLSP